MIVYCEICFKKIEKNEDHKDWCLNRRKKEEPVKFEDLFKDIFKDTFKKK
jgi:hypothetical protein